MSCANDTCANETCGGNAANAIPKKTGGDGMIKTTLVPETFGHNEQVNGVGWSVCGMTSFSDIRSFKNHYLDTITASTHVLCEKIQKGEVGKGGKARSLSNGVKFEICETSNSFINSSAYHSFQSIYHCTNHFTS